MEQQIAIVIPARFGSTRFEGKPLVKIGSKTMLEHCCDTALLAARSIADCQVIVATEDNRILQHAQTIDGVDAVMTSDQCASGSDRSLAAIDCLNLKPQAVINLQGDAPFTPAKHIIQIANALLSETKPDVVTPAAQLSWEELDRLRDNKQQTPFSGTTVTFNRDYQALWFSKNIIPAIRKETAMRQHSDLSPIHQHIGLYGFQLNALRQFVSLPEAHYEQLEGLEQLRLLENGLQIQIEIVTYEKNSLMPGIDTPEDLARVTALLKQQGNLD